MNEESRKQHFKNLLTIALADGILDKGEIEFLFQKSSKYYLTLKDIEGITENAMHVKSAYVNDENTRCEKMLELIDMMLIDGEVHEREKRLCMSFGVSLGFNADHMEKLVTSALNAHEEGATPEEMLAIIKTFL